MRMRLFTAIGTTMLVSLALACAPALAKTAKDCQKEWRADKAAQAAGKTEKAYVAECTGKAAAKPADAPARDAFGGKM